LSQKCGVRGLSAEEEVGMVKSVYCAGERTECEQILQKPSRKDGYKKGGERERQEDGRGRNGRNEGWVTVGRRRKGVTKEGGGRREREESQE
jgi:hypothetical protein